MERDGKIGGIRNLPDHWTQVLGLGTQVDSSHKFGDLRLESDSEGNDLRLDSDSRGIDSNLTWTCDKVTRMTQFRYVFLTI